MAASFQFFEDAAGEHRYRFKGGNGETMFVSEGYRDPTDARRGAEDAIDAILALALDEQALEAQLAADEA